MENFGPLANDALPTPEADEQEPAPVAPPRPKRRRKAAPKTNDDGWTPTTPKPTAQWVMGLYRVRQSEGDEAHLRNLIRGFRQFTGLTHEITIPETFKAISKQIRTPFIRDAWLRTTAALTQHPPVAHVTPRDETVDAEKAASIGEMWTQAAWEQMARDLKEDHHYESARALVRDGESVLKVIYRPDAWANFPMRDRDDTGDYTEAPDHYTARYEAEKKRRPLPFAARIVDRLQMLFGDGEFGDSWVLEYGEYPRNWLSSTYGMVEQNVDGKPRLVDPKTLLGGKPKPEGLLVTGSGRSIKYEYWDQDWWCVVIDGQMAPGFPKVNPYAPKLPYFRAKTDSSSETILFPLMFLVPRLDSALTMKLNWMHLGAYPSPVVEQVPNANQPALEFPTGEDGVPAKITWKPGKAMQLPAGWTFRFEAPPPVGKDLDDMARLLREMIDIAGIPSVFRGVGGADQAGYAINQLIAAAQLTYRRLGQALQRQFEEASEFLWWVVEHRVGESVPVLASGKDAKKWLALKPTGSTTTSEAPVDKLGPLEFTFRPVLPTDEQAKAMIAVQLVNAPKQLISKRYALEHFLNVEDPEEMADEIAVEDMLDSDPQLHDMITQQALKEAGITPPQPAGPPPGPGGVTNPPGPPQGGPPQVPPGPGQMQPQPAAPQPGDLNGVPGAPSVPGVTMPLGGPQPPNAPPIAPARSLGGVAGGFPGQPGGPRQ